jgi:coenzyme F420-0:L-glutamate ligase / coenzyme F420-1:gamma-L-glutamate ligase
LTGQQELRVLPVPGIPEIRAGDRIGELVAARCEPGDDDILVVSQKIVSKAEARVVLLADVEPGEEAVRLAAELGKDPALVELILRESSEVLRAERGVIISRTHHGFVCAHAGVDTSNVPAGFAALLPGDPDASARRIRDEVQAGAGCRPAVVVSDSFSRSWRLGQTEVAIGCAGLQPLDDWRGRRDQHGGELVATLIAVADEAAGAADLVRDKASGDPAALVRGLQRYVTTRDGPGAAAIRRPRSEDLFR